MSEVWEFKNGVTRKVENPGGSRPQKVLVYLPTMEVITSHQMLQNRLREEGDFSRLSTVHMHDIVVKCRNVFAVRKVLFDLNH
ncbi:flowering-promoting factor 1-like protein 3 [Zingiber officinale]|uniref:Uncharacterized protein n=1 Tax=Zingiber officinale TaxID=94328 RepID=A0A8J5L0E0_ZINOF|nr:flowering-promoting factor 1-like protein 3 [Zingiber officinale]KAG6502809.1 hypothetical protein ZIOFF_035097 [Zingiber officinale]